MSITIVVFDLDASITVLYYYRENMITVAKKKTHRYYIPIMQ